jgi:hypothetical protein
MGARGAGRSHACGVAGANLESVTGKESRAGLARRKTSHERQGFRWNRVRNVTIQSARYVWGNYPRWVSRVAWSKVG